MKIILLFILFYFSYSTPTRAPTRVPSITPTRKPTFSPSNQPTRAPTRVPSIKPTRKPSTLPTRKPTFSPSITPTRAPTNQPTRKPSIQPSRPTLLPTRSPTLQPSLQPSILPTAAPTSTCPTVDEVITGGSVSSVGYTSQHGKLKLNGIQLVDQFNNPIQLVGVATNHLGYFPLCYTFEALQNLVTNWGITVFRIAVYLDANGYVNIPGGTLNKIDDIVTWCETLGIYVIITWHVQPIGDPNYYLTTPGANTGPAIDFWKTMATNYGDMDHVIYELADEPNGITWNVALQYYNAVINVIRTIDPQTIILVGTTSWSQDIQNPATTPVANPYNVMYTFHFFAGNHGYLYDLFVQQSTVIPIFVTLMGMSTYDGANQPTYDVANRFISIFEGSATSPSISWVTYSLTDGGALFAFEGTQVDFNAIYLQGSCAQNTWTRLSCSAVFTKNNIRAHRLDELETLGPTFSPTNSPTSRPTSTVVWLTIPGASFGDNVYGTIQTSTQNSIAACQNTCGLGCDFYTFNSQTNTCNIKFTDKAAYMVMAFKGQNGFLYGYLRDGGITTLSTSVTTSIAQCRTLCTNSANCDFISVDTRIPTNMVCKLHRLQRVTLTTIGFRQTVTPINNDPTFLGRFDIVGNTGVVPIFANLLPNGKILCTARPEYFRGEPNSDNISPNPARAAQVPYGEISSVFDPITYTRVPVQIDDNIFCHGSILTEDGLVFTAGGDNGPDINRAVSIGLTDGLKNFRYFNPATNTWNVLFNKLQVTRWYPTIFRTINGKFWIIGGMADATGTEIQMSMEYWDPTLPLSYTTLYPLTVLQQSRMVGYPNAFMIPQSGNIFLFSSQEYAVINYLTGAEIERESQWVHGSRTGDYPGGGCILPLREDANGFVRAEFVLFGGVEQPYVDETAISDVAHIVITDPIGTKTWFYDTDRMPYGRVLFDSVLYPNGHILILNGARYGRSGGAIGYPLTKASATDVFDYNPEAPAGSKFRVLGFASRQRLYHSTAILIPDGRIMIMGTDQATFVEGPTAYGHEAEAFTPPWLLDGSIRPVITSVPAGVIIYGTLFTITYTGTVDKVSILTPQSQTHASEMTQRLYFPTIISKTATQIVLRAPKDPTVMLQGDHMIFAVNGDTPSVGLWIRLGTA